MVFMETLIRRLQKVVTEIQVRPCLHLGLKDSWMIFNKISTIREDLTNIDTVFMEYQKLSWTLSWSKKTKIGNWQEEQQCSGS